MKNNNTLLAFTCSFVVFILLMLVTCDTHVQVKALQLENAKLRDTLFQLHLQVLELEEELNNTYVLDE